MSDPNQSAPLTRELDQVGDSLPQATAPPIHAMVRRSRQLRRRRSRTVAAVAASLALGAGTVALAWSPKQSGGSEQMPAAHNEPAVPKGFRLRGLLGVGVVVPQGWGDDATLCNGTPKRNTVAIGPESWCAMASPFPADTRMVTLDTVAPLHQVTTTSRRLGQWQGELSAQDCQEMVCTQTWWLKQPGVKVTVTSSRASAAADLPEMLGWVRALPSGETGLPSWQAALSQGQEHSGADYRRGLEARGLRVQINEVLQRGMDGGYLLGVSPDPGTVLSQGSTVTLKITAAPQRPSDELSIGVNSSNAEDDDLTQVTDAQLRVGHTLRLGVGDTLWGVGQGKRSTTLRGTITSGSGVLRPRTEPPNLGRSWTVLGVGTAHIEFWITVQGRRVVVGSLTVQVA